MNQIDCYQNVITKMISTAMYETLIDKMANSQPNSSRMDERKASKGLFNLEKKLTSTALYETLR